VTRRNVQYKSFEQKDLLIGQLLLSLPQITSKCETREYNAKDWFFLTELFYFHLHSRSYPGNLL